jgi:hypothetical protein
MTKNKIVICILVGAIFLTGYLIIAPKLRLEWKRPAILAYEKYDGVLNQVADDVLHERVGQRSDGQGFEIDTRLALVGVTYIRLLRGCVVFTFASLPSDATAELVYLPNGYRELPFLDQGVGGHPLIQMEYINDNWCLCLFD